MVAEVFAGVSALKSAFDMAKGLKDIDDATRRNAAVIELQEKILSAQTAQAELLETVGELKKRVAEFERWDAERERYELKQLAPTGAAFAYAIKPDAQGSEPFHCICAACYQNAKKSILQFSKSIPYSDGQHVLTCPSCRAEVHCVEWPPRQQA